MFSVDFKGLNKTLGQLGRYIDSLDLAVQKALYREGEELMSDSKRLVPVDEGVLINSGFVDLPKKDNKNEPFVDVGFGGPAGRGNHGGETNSVGVGYAVIQHEDLTLNHVNGQAKYLEQPLLARKDGYSRRIADRILKNL